ncbi:MAG: hypothetical protein ACXWYD_22325 [Candidatus Binatia bacterium]
MDHIEKTVAQTGDGIRRIDKTKNILLIGSAKKRRALESAGNIPRVSFRHGAPGMESRLSAADRGCTISVERLNPF